MTKKRAMTSRIMKSVKNAVEHARKTISGSNSDGGADYITPKTDLEASVDLIMSNVYGKRCVDDLQETVTGKGFEKGSDDVIKLLKPEILKRLGKDYFKSGNGFLEIVVFAGKVTGVYFVPVLTMKAVKKKKVNGFDVITYAQYIDGEEKNRYDEFTEHVWEVDKKDESKKSYILHFMNYENDTYYGTPRWIAGKNKMKVVNHGDEFVDSFFEDDAIPSGVFWTKGAELDEDGEDGVADILESRNKGPRNRRNFLHIHMDEDSELGYEKFNDNIVDMSFINLNRDLKVDICAGFGVPPKKVGLEIPGRLGSGSDYPQQLAGYYEDVVIPEQQYFESKFQIVFPDEELQLTRPPKVENSAEKSTLEKGEKKKESVVDLLLRLREELEDGC